MRALDFRERHRLHAHMGKRRTRRDHHEPHSHPPGNKTKTPLPFSDPPPHHHHHHHLDLVLPPLPLPFVSGSSSSTRQAHQQKFETEGGAVPSVLALCLKDTAGFYQRLGFAETPMNLAPKQMQVMAAASFPPSPLCSMHLACCLLQARPRARRNQAGRSSLLGGVTPPPRNPRHVADGGRGWKPVGGSDQGIVARVLKVQVSGPRAQL